MTNTIRCPPQGIKLTTATPTVSKPIELEKMLELGGLQESDYTLGRAGGPPTRRSSSAAY